MKKLIRTMLSTCLILLVGCSAGTGTGTTTPANTEVKTEAQKTEAQKNDVKKEENSMAGSSQSSNSSNSSHIVKGNLPKKIKLATIPNIEPRLQIAKEILAEIGVEVEIVVFDGNSMPATALKDGEVDGILVNHLKWINTFNKANNSNLKMQKPYYYYSPIRMYSKKWKSIAEFPENARIGVSNDPSNLEIALLMLQREGLIKLGDKTGDFYTEVDITENPKKIQLVMSETINVAKGIDDLDAVVSFAFYAVKAGGVKVDDFLAENPTDREECPVGVIVQEKDLDSEWAVYLAENFLKDKWIEKADAQYPVGAYPYYR